MVLHITPSDTSSIEASGNAFADDGTIVPDFTLIVDANAYLISTGAGSGASLTGSWTVTINGDVEGFGGVGIFLSQASTVTVGRTGDVFGGVEGIVTPGGLTLTNFGTIGSNVGFTAISSGGETHIRNAGRVAGLVSLSLNGATNDSFTDFIKVGKVIKNGTVTNVINLGPGDDHFNGGANAETVSDGAGADIYKLGGGNDTYLAFGGAGDSTDIIDGGKGVDTYDASSAASPLFINLDSVAHTDLTSLSGVTTEAAHSAQGTQISGGVAERDAITGFENVSGGLGADTIFGNGQANVLKGNGGVDHLFAGKGADILSGGTGADTFFFERLSDSTVAKSGRDTITDFEVGLDKIGLISIDAIKGGVDDPFTYIGAKNFHHVAGELREFFTDGGNTIVSGDVNGDGKADFSIKLLGHILLDAGDFYDVA